MKYLWFVIVAVLISQPMFAAVMTSTNYSIQSDSVNFGGGFSTSTNFTQESTFGEIATGLSDSTNFTIQAGYQQLQVTFLAISAVSDVVLSPAIDSTTGGVANGSATVTVKTNNSAGYELYIKASTSPALASGINSFADYTPLGVDPDLSFFVAITAAEFGFSPEGADVAQKYLDNGISCNVGALETSDSCWNALSTSNELIAENASSNYPTGTATTIKFRAESGSSNVQPTGTYVATTTVTAIAL